MALFLEILSGDLHGNRTLARNGVTIGRRGGHITLRDSKVSGKHAEIQERVDGSLWLMDVGSSNGIKTARGRVRELKIEAGTTFTIGRTQFQVISTDDAGAPEDSTQAGAITVTRTFWDSIRELTQRSIANAKVQRREVAAFDPVVRLKFIRGVQTGTEWTLGYGPRSVGTSSLDLTLEDASLPATCFRLEPQDQGILFRNETEKEVRLNGKWVQSEMLQDGDVIEIVNTQIKVSLERLGEVS